MINQQMFMVGGKKEGRGWGRKKTYWPFSCWSAGASTLFFSESPTSNHATLSKYQV
ncbi:hypothetical protein [Aneurinibacillus migulanus]|uniref:hypothetical protein n=1 Tax=Aneurinibacillus migulanus TaxID=47500 RepID=UPI001F18C378|nr:hypothetical protein [Aneurinibacillus migulanus]